MLVKTWVCPCGCGHCRVLVVTREVLVILRSSLLRCPQCDTMCPRVRSESCHHMNGRSHCVSGWGSRSHHENWQSLKGQHMSGWRSAQRKKNVVLFSCFSFWSLLAFCSSHVEGSHPECSGGPPCGQSGVGLEAVSAHLRFSIAVQQSGGTLVESRKLISFGTQVSGRGGLVPADVGLRFAMGHVLSCSNR